MTDKPNFGARVVVSARLKKHKRNGRVTWKREELTLKREGIYIGYRTVFDGDTEYDYDEGRTYLVGFVQYEKHNVYLVAVSPRENPIHVLPEDMEILHD